MRGSFQGELRSGSRGRGDSIVTHGAPLVVKSKRQRHETGSAQSLGHLRAAMWRYTEEEKSPATRSGDLATIGSAIPRDLIPAVDLRGAHAPRQTALELPALVQERSEPGQVTGQQRLRHGGGELFDAMQPARHLAVRAGCG